MRVARWAWVGCAALVVACSGSGPGASATATSQGPSDAPDGAGSTGSTGTTDGGGGAATGTTGTTTGTGEDPGDGGTTSNAGTTFEPPITLGHWTFYGSGQGLSPDVSDVSADEAGNVYVAGGDALYVKRREAAGFGRYDAQTSGLTQNCYDTDGNDPAALDGTLHPTPPGPARMCRVISVAGAAPGVAFVGFQGIGTDFDADAAWAKYSGGADLVAFDGSRLTRSRHILIASAPHDLCAADNRETHADSCSNPWEYYWVTGRAKLRQVYRIAVNHQQGSAMYGDAWMGGTHATLAAYLNNAAQRGWIDKTAGQDPMWADAKDVWEHEHPAIPGADPARFLTGYTYGVAIDPRTGTPWGSNGFRTAYLAGYGANLSSKVWWLPLPWLDVWPDGADPEGPGNDSIASLSFCDDGTLWMGSSTHGLVRRDPGGGLSVTGLPDPQLHGDSVTAVACDPADRSVWIGLGWGGVMRYRNGQFTTFDPNAFPEVFRRSVQSIQIDRWTSPRSVYFAFTARRGSDGSVTGAGGVAAYDGP